MDEPVSLIFLSLNPNLRSPVYPRSKPPFRRYAFTFTSRYFKQDSAVEIAARDTLVKGYIKLKLNTGAADGGGGGAVPLDDEEDPDAAAGEMTPDKVSHPRGVQARVCVLLLGHDGTSVSHFYSVYHTEEMRCLGQRQQQQQI